MNNHLLAAPLEALYARVPLGMRLGLEPMRKACARADHPEKAFRAVHVGGTNGKGSTAAMVEAIARAAGARTGLYTSPHLSRFAERIRIDGQPLEDDVLAVVLEQALAIGDDLSFFETATLAAFLAFRAAEVDLAIIEVGIGGRLDATNVLPAPACTAITKVALDHEDRLGDSLVGIAREKAGIAKRDCPLVLGPSFSRDAETRGAVNAIAKEAGARVVLAPPLPAGTEIGLFGDHQKDNAAVAWAIADALGIDDDLRAKGLRNARWPGRLERLRVDSGRHAGRWLIDGAHNPDGIDALVAAVRSRDVGAIVFGALADKAWQPMLDALRAIEAPRFYVAPKGRAAQTPSALAARVPGTIATSLDDALTKARAASGDREILVCGSIYLVGEARAALLDLPSDPPVAL